MRILSLLLSLAIMAFLAYFMIDRMSSPSEISGIKEGDTIIDTIDYAEEAKTAAELSSCLRLCGIDFENQTNCEVDCNEKYK